MKPTRSILLFLGCCWPSLIPAQSDAPLPGGGDATPVSSITIGDGFEIQLLRSARQNEGSWISMTFDDRGRLILGRDARGIVRLTLSATRGPAEQSEVAEPTEVAEQVEVVEFEVVEFEVIDDQLRHCRGVLYAHDSLYVNATDSKGFYRLRDTTGDDQFDQVELLKAMDYEYRYGHGANQVVLGPDEQIYLVIGNDIAMLDGRAADSPYRDPQDDHLLIEPRDAVESIRVGTIVKTDPEGERWEVIAGGFRNQFDLAFNTDGEMFTYDADMEWDVGLPWYRPTRLNHVVSGGEYGWRWGTGKWPTYFPDSLPTTLDTALGSPTGLVFATDSNFPPPYRDALYMGDWQNGRILRVVLEPAGASYKGSYDVFLQGAALNVCDMAIGPDGAMYFITGGRGSQSGLYRVTWQGPHESGRRAMPAESASVAEAKKLRQLRRRLEVYHQRRDPQAVDIAWPYLNSNDRWLRYAARLAVQRQDLADWRDKALSESRPGASIAALLALARRGRSKDQSALLRSLNRLAFDELTREQLLDALRVYGLSFIRQGAPTPADRRLVLKKLDPAYPHPSGGHVNRELARLLLYLEAPEVVPRTVALISAATSQEDAVFLAQHLARVRDGWTPETRSSFFDWLVEAQTYRGGKLLYETLKHIREDWIATLTNAEQSQYESRVNALAVASDAAAPPPSLPIVKHWKWEDLEPALQKSRRDFDPQRGRAALAKASCTRCHRFGEQGSYAGPDLTHVGRHYDERALLESILSPSKVIDEKYQVHTYVLEDGRVLTGRPIGVTADTITLETDAMQADSVPVPRAEIAESRPSEISPMPTGLVDVLTKREVFDLIMLLKTGVQDNEQ